MVTLIIPDENGKARPADRPRCVCRRSRANTPRPARVGRAPKTRLLLRRTGVWLALVFVLALGVRLVYLAQIRAIPYYDQPVGDAKGYYEWAQRIASAATFRQWLGETSFYQAPLYPYVLGAWFKAAGDGLTALRGLQAAWGSLAAVLLAWAMSRPFGRAAGLIAGVMFALYPPAIYFDGLIQKASLDALLISALLAAMASLPAAAGARPGSLPVSDDSAVLNRVARRRWRVAALLVLIGALLGVLILTRENAMIWAPLLAIWAARTTRTTRSSNEAGRGGSQPAGWAAAAAFAAGLAVVLAPVGLRNLAVGGEWSISTFQAGPNFYIGNSTHADGRYRPMRPGRETPEFERRDATELAERDVGHALTPREVSRYWTRRAWEDIRDDPGRWLKLMGLKALMVVNAYEVGDVEAQSVYQAFSPLLAVLSMVWHFGVLAPLAAAGMVLARRRRPARTLAALIAAMAAAVVLFYVLGRYRYPLAVLMTPLAAAAVVRGVRVFRHRGLRGLLAPAAAAVITAVLCNHVPVHPVEELDASGIMNLGTAYAIRNGPGDMERAAGCFSRALEAIPDTPMIHVNLAQALHVLGRYEPAARHYQTALRLNPELENVDYLLGTVLERLGRLREAADHYQRALRVNPSDTDADAALARLRPRLEAAPHE